MTYFKISLASFALITSASLMCPNQAHAAVLNLSGAMTDANSVENTTNTDPKAFDGNTGTRWATRNTAGDNAWIWVDFGSDYTLQSVAIDWEFADATTYKLFKLSATEASNIGFLGNGSETPVFSNWVEIASVDDAVDGTNHDIDTFNFVNQTVTLGRSAGTGITTISNQPVARFLLINPISDKDINGGVSIWEVTVDATPVPEPGSLALMGLGGLLIARRRRR